MSNTIHIDDSLSFPDIEIAHDLDNTVDIGSIDVGLLANQKKLGSPGRSVSPLAEMRGDDIEFVSLEDTIPSVSFDVKANTSSDPIRIVRDTTGSSIPAARPIAPIPTPSISIHSTAPASAPAPGGLSGLKSWFSSGPAAPAEPSQSSGGGLAGIKSWFGGSGGGSSGSGNGHSSHSSNDYGEMSASRVQEYLTPEQEFAKKSEAVMMLERMDRKGITGNKMTMANTLEEVLAEVDRRKDSKALEASIRFQRSMLTTVTNGMEFLNSRFDPLGVRLDGWSEQVNENIEDYDEIFEELYDKYKDKSKVAPEVRLIMSLGLSAAMCHVTNTMFKSRMPGMDDILRNNPDLARQFAQAAAQEAVGPGFANFVGMGMNNSRRPSVAPQMPQQQAPRSPPPRGDNGMFSGMASVMGFGGGSQPPVATARRPMRGPTGVDDILQRMNQAGEELPERSVPMPASPQLEAEEAQSIRSGFTTETARMAGRSRRRPTTSQPVGATLTLNV